ncbi:MULTISPECIES: hypothetical protein [Rhodopseudomonas]|jgi:hypothetical protein|uniref:hypothetical protein n=1 Tax=Rhodopseudomonas TaxID=1073 RepID=UPI000DF190DE|nr:MULTISPECIES: hypothetical protein [Rhodopseudomonas]
MTVSPVVSKSGRFGLDCFVASRCGWFTQRWFQNVFIAGQFRFRRGGELFLGFRARETNR